MTEDETTPPQNPEDRETESSSASSAPQKRIGPYKILETLGEGGMGVVYLAEQVTPIRRRVAVKVIKLGMDTEQVIARFESERQALAILNHPNIAKVLDAGVAEQGRPYFVMEYVPGLPISLFCDQRRLNIRERLDLFGQACEAIQHAHRNGIIHRDIKPSNMLVWVQDDKPVVKVIDFGLAKATSQRLTEKTLYTQHGVLIGTPEYISPEQAGTTALDVDSRTDIYSLGVVLYELLVGALPFDPAMLRQAAGLEMLRIIREVDPPKPTTRISSLGDRAREVAARRHTEVKVLTKLLRGELEWITMRALEKDPARRYPSAQEFVSDIRRYLSGEPVLAHRPNAAYRLRKLVQRRKVMVVGAVTVAALLVIGLVAGVTAHSREEAAKDAALRWTLEQVIEKGADPKSIQPNWSELARRMKERNRSNPRSDLAWLSLRAAAQVEVTAPRFGLRSKLPSLEVRLKQFGSRTITDLVEPGIPYLYVAEIEGSWDGAPWKALSTGWVHQVAVEDMGWSLAPGLVPLSRFLTPDQITVAPHQLKLRVHYKWINPDTASAHTTPPSSSAQFSYWPPEDFSLLPSQGPILLSDTRDLDPLSISVFDEYPADFPKQVFQGDTSGTLGNYFRLDRMRLLRVSLPRGPLSGEIHFARPGRFLSIAVAPSEITAARPVVVGFEMEGSMVGETPLPIAAAATLRAAGTGQSVVEFPLAFGPGTLDLGQRSLSACNEDGVTTLIIATGEARSIVVPPPEVDHTFQGQLELTPSREIALNTKRFDHYLGSKVTIPVEVEVLTVQGFASVEALRANVPGTPCPSEFSVGGGKAEGR